MLMLRKIDHYGQLILGILMVLTIPVLIVYGLLLGLLALGAWQLISAAFNTMAFSQKGMRSSILNYWILSGVDLAVLFYADLFRESLGNEFATFLMTLPLFGAGAIAIYYWIILRRLIMEFELRKELSAFTKSKA